MKRLIVNADDFGLCQGANLGILVAHEQGIVTSATLMVNMPGADEAFAIACANPLLGVGIHLTLTAGSPVAGGVESLTGPDGRFLKLPALLERARPEHIIKEIRAQVAAFHDRGLSPTHLDSHHHVHIALPAAQEAVTEVARELGLPVRQLSLPFIPEFYGSDQITPEWLTARLARLEEGVSELMCHPAYLDPYLLQHSSYAQERVTELATLTEPTVVKAVKTHGIELISYREAQERR